MTEEEAQHYFDEKINEIKEIIFELLMEKYRFSRSEENKYRKRFFRL